MGENAITKVEVQNIIRELLHFKEGEFVSKHDILKNEVDNIVSRLQEDDFILSVVGEFSSGKSTFLNALIGKDILPHALKETTATITVIENVKEIENADYFDAYFVDGNVEKGIPVSELEDFTAKKSNKYDVAKEVERVVIKSHVIDTDSKFYLIDTPGLNGIASYHREKTIELVKKSHACIYLISLRGLAESDLEFVKYISKYQKNIIFVQNFIDELNDLENETPEMKIEEQKKVINQFFSDEQLDVSYSLVGMSAAFALVGRDNTVNLLNIPNLDKKKRKDLLDQSGYSDVIRKIQDLLELNEEQSLQKRATLQYAYNYFKRLMSLAQNQEIEENKNNKNLKKIQQYNEFRAYLLNNKDRFLKKLDNHVINQINKLKYSISKKTYSSLGQVISDVKDEIYHITNVNDMDTYVSSISQAIEYKVFDIENNLIVSIDNTFNVIYHDALLSIEDFSSLKQENVRLPELKKTSLDKIQRMSFKTEKEELSKENDELFSQIKEKSNLMTKIDFQKEKLQKYKSQRSEAVYKDQQVLSQKQSKIKRLSKNKPVIEEKIVKTELHGFSKIVSQLKGEGGVKREVFKDDSMLKVWEKTLQQLKYDYQKTKGNSQRSINSINMKIKQLEKEINDNEQNLKYMNMEINSGKMLLESKKELLINKQTLATKEYLNNIRTKLIETIEAYFSDSVQPILEDHFIDYIEKNGLRINQKIDQMFLLSYDQKISEYDALISNKDFDMVTKHYSNEIKKIIKLLEVYQ